MSAVLPTQARLDIKVTVVKGGKPRRNDVALYFEPPPPLPPYPRTTHSMGPTLGWVQPAAGSKEMALDRETSEALWKMRSSDLLSDSLLKTLHGGPPSLLSSTYKRVIWVGTENVESVSEAAGYLCVTDLIQDCCEFLHSIMSLENCISTCVVANCYNCFDPESKTYRYLMQHFTDILKRSEEFFKLKIDEVESLLSDENVNAVLRWVEFNPANREQHVARLLNCVRTGLVDTAFVEQIKVPIVTDSLHFMYGPSVVARNDEVRAPALARPRIPHEAMFVIGGWMNGGPTTCIKSYDSKTARWVKVEGVHPAGPRAYDKCAAIGSRSCVLGGFNADDYFRSARCFNTHTKTWRSTTPMHVKKGYISVVVPNDIIYAVGGYDGREWQSYAKNFDYRNNQCTAIASINQQRIDTCTTARNGYVYLTGGFSGSECLSSTERYDPQFDQWTAIVSMRYRRSGVGCIGLRDSIYAIGSFSGHSKLFSAEKYNTGTNTWTLLPTITEQWYEATSMNEGRSAIAACAISGLLSVHDYVHDPYSNLMEEKHQKILNILKNNLRHLKPDLTAERARQRRRDAGE
ncbi:hypothetical protein HPB48_021512 [Haemaphysalis longicornis]|uniref:BACK domain-containing protein n=1 Tax=Haemaphysalis longicornis TaxID=44386 RepID=A0A9J6FUT3_HAELO|nr:hypothetical protein HPB48_021512 [Haemaphysalis longicornis]